MKVNKSVQIADNVAKGNELLITAKQHDENKNYDEAVKFYILAVEYFKLARKYEMSLPQSKILYSKILDCLDRAEAIKGIADEHKGESTNSNSASAVKAKGKTKDKNENDKDDKDSDKVQIGNSIFVATSPNVKFDDIIGLAETKKLLQAALVWPIKFADIYTANDTSASRSMLLYGPPGTGKTQLAKAVATEMKCSFITVSSTDIMSKWLGDSEKIIRRIFEIAREKAPTVMFFDEVDGILSSRTDSNTSEAANKVKNEILTNMSGFQGITDKEKFVFVLAATNNPSNLDIAVVRRFEQRLYIPLPDADARCLMFKKKLDKCVHKLSEDDYKAAADATDQYSGADIEIVTRYCKESALRKYADATEFKVNSEGKYIPIKYADDVEGETVTMNFNDIVQNQVCVLPIVLSDLIESITKNKPSTSAVDCKKYDEFTAKFGTLGI